MVHECSCTINGAIVLHVVDQLLALSVVPLEDAVDILSEGVVSELLLARFNLDLLVVDVLLEAAHVIVPRVEVVGPRKPLVLHLLLLDVVLGLLHVYEHLLQLLLLLVALVDRLRALNELTDLKVRRRQGLYLEVNYRSAHLHGLGLGQAQVEATTHKDKGSELRHVILEVEAIILEANHCMLSRHTDVVDAEIGLVASAKSD